MCSTSILTLQEMGIIKHLKRIQKSFLSKLTNGTHHRINQDEEERNKSNSNKSKLMNQYIALRMNDVKSIFNIFIGLILIDVAIFMVECLVYKIMTFQVITKSIQNESTKKYFFT